jgi:hypothetical protein
MEAILKVKPLKLQTREEYFAELRQSLEDTKNGNLVSFTVKEFEEFIKK